MTASIRWGDDEVPVIFRDWPRYPQRLPYHKTYRLKPGDNWRDAATTNEQWEHYVQAGSDFVPAGAMIARELVDEGAITAVWTECWGRKPVFMSKDLACVDCDRQLWDILAAIRAKNGRWAGLPDVVALFPDGRVAMREAKVKGKDRLNAPQHAFARVARSVLGDRLDLAVVEWGADSAAVMKTKTVGKRSAAQTPAEFHSLGAQLDRELAVVRPFTRKRGFVVKARTWEEMTEWENRRIVEEAKQTNGE